MHLAYRELAPPNLCALGQRRAPCEAVPHPEHMWAKQHLLVHPSLCCHFVHKRWLVALATSCLLTRLAKVSYFPSQVLSLSHSMTGTVCGSMPRHTAHGSSVNPLFSHSPDSHYSIVTASYSMTAQQCHRLTTGSSSTVHYSMY